MVPIIEQDHSTGLELTRFPLPMTVSRMTYSPLFLLFCCSPGFPQALPDSSPGALMPDSVRAHSAVPLYRDMTDFARKIVSDPCGNVYVAGNSVSRTSLDYLTIKYDSLGNQVWLARYDSPFHGQDEVNSLAVDKLGNVFVTGYGSYYSAGVDWITIKYDSSGAQQWVTTFGGLSAGYGGGYAIALADSGYIYVTGDVRGQTSIRDIATVKCDSQGNLVWAAYYNGPTNDQVYPDFPAGIALDDSENVFVTGMSPGPGTGRDFITIKYDRNGIQRWAKRFDNPNQTEDFPYDLVTDHSGNVYVTGACGVGPANMSMVTLSYSPSGEQRWVQYYAMLTGAHEDRAVGIAIDSQANIYITGFGTGILTKEDIVTIKYDSSGHQKWLARYDGLGHFDDRGQDIIVDRNGNVFVAGFTRGVNGWSDYILIKYSTEGILQWASTYNGAADSSDEACGLALTNSGRIIVTGQSWSVSTGADFATVSFDALGRQQWVARYNGPGGREVSVPDASGSVQYAFVLNQNYPNPFNPSTTIRYGIPVRSHVILAVYNTLGQQVAQLVNGEVEAGYHDVRFDASALPSGVYFYRLKAGGFVQTLKLLLVR
jgi:hypothetical protein